MSPGPYFTLATPYHSTPYAQTSPGLHFSLATPYRTAPKCVRCTLPCTPFYWPTPSPLPNSPKCSQCHLYFTSYILKREGLLIFCILEYDLRDIKKYGKVRKVAIRTYKQQQKNAIVCFFGVNFRANIWFFRELFSLVPE